MTRLISFFVFFSIFYCSANNEKKYQKPEKVIIAGKVLNFNTRIQYVHLSVNRLGLSSLQIDASLDRLGRFSTSFESYIPTDVWLLYKTNFLVLTHPGDSIYVEFDGEPQNRPDILNTITFGGDAVQSNQYAAVFQKMYFSNPLYWDFDSKKNVIKEYDVDKYLSYLEAVQLDNEKLFEKFESTTHPNEETKIWASIYLEQDYYDKLAMYPFNHALSNQLKYNPKDISEDYFTPLLNRLPITKSMLISGYALSSYINKFLFAYPKIRLQDEKKMQKIDRIQKSKVKSQRGNDSLMVYGIIQNTPDTLLKQMILTEFFRQKIERNSNIITFEQFMDIARKNIQESFLWEPLYSLYLKVKFSLENPKESTEAIFMKVTNSSAKQILDSIMVLNKGKVIYLDFWATWCGPCKAEMPHSKILMEQFYGKDVAFVFVCLDSEEKNWKSTLNELDIGGQHYLLSKNQSVEFRKAFEINAVPNYFLINKEGIIVDKGSHLRPAFVNEKIDTLLK